MKSKLFVMAIVATMLSTTSCKKGLDVAVDVTVGFQVAGVPIDLNITVGTGDYYPVSAYDEYVYGDNQNSTKTVCYVLSCPYDPESINVYDQGRRLIGIVRCWQGTGVQTNMLFRNLQNWFRLHTGPCAVDVEWNLIPFTHGGSWTGTLIG